MANSVVRPLPCQHAQSDASVGLFAALILLLPCAPSLPAQLVTPKTVPVAQGDQFMIFPSRNVGMGGVSIAVADSLLDPFVNPAKATRLTHLRFHGAPLFYSISSDAGGGRTLPLGMVGRTGEWTGGFVLAVQQLDKGERLRGVAERLSERSTVNKYLSAVVGRRLPWAGLSIGGSAYWAGLHALDGVDLLYAGSERIDQAGDMLDLRLGVTKEWSGNRSLDVIVLHSRFDMTHDVTYLDFGFDPVARQSFQRERLEHNQDRTNTWGLHLEYERPLSNDGWRIGWLATGNRHSHPKIPNYQIMNVPRDPGTTYAYNLGIGVARALGPATFGLDVIYEPIWSETWADAARDTATAGGGVIRKGGKTVENDFRFSNAIVRLGVGREAELSSGDARKAIGVQVGVAMHSIDYQLQQVNNVLRFSRRQKEDWVEWTPTWGLSMRFPELEIHYTGRYTTGVGRPGVDRGVAVDRLSTASAPRGGTIIAAPSGPLTLDEVHVVSHQVSFSLPMR